MTQELWATQAGSFSAELTRRAVFSQYARTSANNPGILAGGLLFSSDLALTAPASGMAVLVGVGEAIVGGTEGGSQGGYYFRNTAQLSLSITAADASNPRIDTVVATAADSGYTEPSDVGTTSNGGVLAVVTGTPTAGATLSNLSGAAAVPASSLVIGYVLVPAGATSIVSADVQTVATSVNMAGGLTPGDIKSSANPVVPAGWLPCDGSAVSRTAYPALFAAIGAQYGSGDGSTTFNVPDLRGRVPVGSGAGPGLTSRSNGGTGGEETHVLSVGEVPNLSFGTNLLEWNGSYFATSTMTAGGSPGGNASNGSSNTVTGTSNGGGGAHNNMQPFGVVGWFIKF